MPLSKLGENVSPLFPPSHIEEENSNPTLLSRSRTTGLTACPTPTQKSQFSHNMAKNGQ